MNQTCIRQGTARGNVDWQGGDMWRRWLARPLAWRRDLVVEGRARRRGPGAERPVRAGAPPRLQAARGRVPWRGGGGVCPGTKLAHSTMVRLRIQFGRNWAESLHPCTDPADHCTSPTPPSVCDSPGAYDKDAMGRGRARCSRRRSGVVEARRSGMPRSTPLAQAFWRCSGAPIMRAVRFGHRSIPINRRPGTPPGRHYIALRRPRAPQPCADTFAPISCAEPADLVRRIEGPLRAGASARWASWHVGAMCRMLLGVTSAGVVHRQPTDHACASHGRQPLDSTSFPMHHASSFGSHRLTPPLQILCHLRCQASSVDRPPHPRAALVPRARSPPPANRHRSCRDRARATRSRKRRRPLRRPHR